MRIVTGQKAPEFQAETTNLFAAYGVERSMRGMFTRGVWRDYLRAMRAGFFSRPFGHHGGIKGHPADFLIGPDGIVQLAHYGRDYADTLGADRVLEAAGTGEARATRAG